MSKTEQALPVQLCAACDSCHGNQVVRALLWCDKELEAAIFIKQSCYQFATVQNAHGVTALHVAAAKGWNQMCRWLLRNGADVRAQVKKTSQTPMQFAAMFGNVDTLILLSKAGGCRKGTSVLSQEVYRELYSNIDFSLGDDQPQLSNAYACSFTVFLQCALFEKFIGRVDSASAVQHRLSESTATALNESQLHKKLSHQLRWFMEDDGFESCEKDEEKELFEAVKMSPPQKKKKKKKNLNEGSFVYVFGLNQNYNLGLGTDDRRDRPTQLERLTREQSVVQACLTKYHSLYLTASGTVRASGHGVGGRLGVGTEDTCVRPETVKLPLGTEVVMVAAGVDHSLFLTAAGEVYGCGTNSHHQLGLSTQASDKFITPKKIAVAPARAGCSNPPCAVGVACSDRHSVLWTESDLYTWGTNLGQLGHLHPVVHEPRPVTCCPALVKSSGIYKVCATNVCTVVATYEGTVVVLHYGKYSVVTRSLNEGKKVLSLSCFGGVPLKVHNNLPASSSRLSSHDRENLGKSEPSEIIATLTDEKNRRDITSDVLENHRFAEDELVVVLMTTGNNIYVWSDNSRFLRTLTPLPCGGSEAKQVIVDIVATPSDVLAISNLGEVLKLELFARSWDRKLLNYRSHSLAYLHRARKIFCDPVGQNFAVLTHTSFPKFSIEHNSLQSLVSDMESLYENISEDESFCDVVLLCEGKRFPAHKMILAAKSVYFRDLFSSGTPPKLPSSKDEKDERTQKDALPKARCECCFSRCYESFQALSGGSGSRPADLDKNERNKVEIQKGPEISDELYRCIPDSSNNSLDFEAPDLPTLDVSFLPLDVLQDLLHFCYTGSCTGCSDNGNSAILSLSKVELDRFKLFLRSAGNLNENIVENLRLPSEKDLFKSLTKEDLTGNSDLLKAFEMSVTLAQEEDELEQLRASRMKGAQALRIGNFLENCKASPDPSLHQSLSTGLDVQFEAPDGTLGPKAHRFMLSARVPFFNAFFSGRWTKKSYSPEGLQLVRTLHCHSPAFLLLLQFLYTGSYCCCNLTLPLLQDLIALADELLVTEARTLAEKHMVDFIDRRNVMSMYQFSVNFNCQLLRQHVLFFAYFDTPLMLENRWMENLRSEDVQQILYMNRLMALNRVVNLFCYQSKGMSPRCPPLHYFLPSQLGESGKESRKLEVNSVRYPELENQKIAMALCTTLNVGYNDAVEEDPMLCLHSRQPEWYAEMTRHTDDMAVELDSEDFTPPDGEVELPKCPFTYHTHEPRRLSTDLGMFDSEGSTESEWVDVGSWRNRPSRRRSGAVPEFSFNGLVDRSQESDDEDDAYPWHVVGRRYDVPFAKSLSKGSDPASSCDDRLHDAESSSRSCALYAGSESSKHKNTNVGSSSTTSGKARKKTKRGQHSSSNKTGGPSCASASSCDEESTADKQNMNDSVTSELNEKASSAPSSCRSHDGGPASAAASINEDAAILSNEFPSLAESVKAAAQQQLLLSSKPATSKTTPPFVRTSQKQRKKQMREQKEAEAAVASAPAAAPVAPKTPTPAWGLASSSAAPAEHQPEFEFPSLSSGRVRRTSQRTLSSSSGGSDFGVGSPQSPSNFSAIMQREKTMRENYEKSQRKSLEHIQMEERAISELEQYYCALAGDADTITVKRHSAPQSLPLWTEKHRPHDML